MAEICAVNGQLIKWAREQQGITLRSVLDRGGPSIGFQSEVERGRKTEVSSKTLQTWVRVLGVTENFARGQVPRYGEAPLACKGLACDVLGQIRIGPEWVNLSPSDRLRLVLQQIATSSRKVPRVVLAYVLGIELQTLDRIIHGPFVVAPWMAKAASDLTSLPEDFFVSVSSQVLGEMDQLNSYRVVVSKAVQLGITPQDLLDMVERAAWVRE